MTRRLFSNFIKVCEGLVFSLVLTSLVSAADLATDYEVLKQHHDGVLGTSLDLTIYGSNKVAMVAAADLALKEIGRLEQIFSTYRKDSELMQLNEARQSNNVSPELRAVIESCNEWYIASDGQFSCRLGQVLSLWDEAESSQLVPERPEVRRLARDVQQAEILIDHKLSLVELEGPISLDPSGLSKGYIIDQGMTLLRQKLPDSIAIKLDIGGDAYYWGSPPGESSWQVGIADPNNTTDNSGYIGTLGIKSMAVAASGHNSRTRSIERRKFSHILVPRDGWPVEHGLASVVIARDAITADAIATALTVQTMVQAIDWVNTLSDVEALVVTRDGRQMSSVNWQAYILEEYKLNTGDSIFNFTLDYTLPTFNTASYNRPYVSIWITDTSQKALKNLLVLGATERWARENTRWWRRVGRRNPQLLDGVARATRGAGEYQIQWDGLDDFGEIVPSGEYILHLEASRESGGSSYQAIPFTLGTASQSFSLEPEGELGSISLEIWN